jgi:hypothetical protein
MPWIENVAAADIPTKFHHDAGPNSMLISITDPASWRPTPAHEFKERHDFEFLDVEKNDHVIDEIKTIILSCGWSYLTFYIVYLI